jgi:hypothetical protein
MKKFLVLVIITLVGCKGKSELNYLESNTELFDTAFNVIFKNLFDTIPSQESIFFIDTLSLESDVHRDGIFNWIEGLPERWPKNEVFELVQEFTLNKEVILIDKLTLPYTFINDPVKINNLSPNEEKRNFGTIRLSNFIYNESKTKVVFFFICYCGNSCSKGGLVYVNRLSSSSDWHGVEVLEVWGS